MADAAKYGTVHAGSFVSDFASHRRARRTLTYGFLFVFVSFTLFLAFFPSPNSASPWFANIFTLAAPGRVAAPPSYSVFWGDYYRSHFSSVVAFFFPTSQSNDSSYSSNPSFDSGTLPGEPKVLVNQTQSSKAAASDIVDNRETKQNLSRAGDFQGKLNTSDGVSNPPKNGNQTLNSANGGRGKYAIENLNASLAKEPSTGRTEAGANDGGLIASLSKCNMFDGNWVKDESYPLYRPGSCSLIDEQFNCFLNGRPDSDYYKLKWKPRDCTLPRLNASHMLEMLRGKRLVFVGDSLNRNMWESLICILKSAVKDEKKVYEEMGRHHFRTEASYSFVFEDYKCTVEFFVSPFLVQEWEVTEKNGKKKETLRLDLVSKSADKYRNADIIVFNTGHWWTHEKTSTGKDYYQEGSHVYSELNVLEAFRKALTHWGRWVDANINPKKSLLFFRGYSASHFSGGQWNSGGRCDHELEPIKNASYRSWYPPKMGILEKVLRGMKNPVTYMNVTRMTDYRKDGHPSVYRKLHMSDEERRSPFQDCSHWCLPGVPDSWNEILYAQLLVKMNQVNT